MNNQNKPSDKRANPISVQEVIDRDLINYGDDSGHLWTQEELDESRRQMDQCGLLISQGYSINEAERMCLAKNNVPVEMAA